MKTNIFEHLDIRLDRISNKDWFDEQNFIYEIIQKETAKGLENNLYKDADYESTYNEVNKRLDRVEKLLDQIPNLTIFIDLQHIFGSDEIMDKLIQIKVSNFIENEKKPNKREKLPPGIVNIKQITETEISPEDELQFYRSKLLDLKFRLANKNEENKSLPVKPLEKSKYSVAQTAILLDYFRRKDFITCKGDKPLSILGELLTGHSKNTLRLNLSINELEKLKERGEKAHEPLGNLKKLNNLLRAVRLEIKGDMEKLEEKRQKYR